MKKTLTTILLLTIATIAFTQKSENFFAASFPIIKD